MFTSLYELFSIWYIKEEICLKEEYLQMCVLYRRLGVCVRVRKKEQAVQCYWEHFVLVAPMWNSLGLYLGKWANSRRAHCWDVSVMVSTLHTLGCWLTLTLESKRLLQSFTYFLLSLYFFEDQIAVQIQKECCDSFWMWAMGLGKTVNLSHRDLWLTKESSQSKMY